MSQLSDKSHQNVNLSNKKSQHHDEKKQKT